MIFPITALCVVGCLVFAHGERGSGLFLGLCVWAFGVIATALPLLDIHVEYSLLADGILGGSLVAITGGYLLVRKPGQAPARNDALAIRLIKGFSIVGLLGCGLLLLDAYRSGLDINPLTAFGRLDDVREGAFDRLYSGVSPSALAQLGSYLSPASYLAVIICAQVGRSAGRVPIALACASFTGLVAVGFLVYGGRSIPLFAALLAVIAWYMAGGRLHFGRRGLVIAGVVAVAAVFFSVTWVQSREQNNLSSDGQLAALARADYHPLIASAARGNSAIGTALVSYTYFAANMPSFAFYVGQEIPGPLWGAYSYPLVYQYGGRVIGKPARPWTDVRGEVFGPLEANGYFGNIWATWMRDLVVDFGVFGALIFCALFGAFMAFVRNMYEATGKTEFRALEVIATFTFSFGAFTGLLYFTTLEVAFFMAVALWAARALLAAPKRRRRGASQPPTSAAQQSN